MDADAETETVKERHGGEHFVADVEHGVCGDDLLAEGIEVPVRQDDALRGAGGPAGIQDDRGVIRLAGDPVMIEAVAGETHELLPADNRGVLGDLPDLPALGQHIAGTNRARESILDRGDDDVDHAGVGADVFEFVIELIQCDGGDRLGFVQVKLMACGQFGMAMVTLSFSRMPMVFSALAQRSTSRSIWR